MAHYTSELIPEDTLEKAVKLLNAVSHPGRLQIVNILLNGECQVGELVNKLGKLQSFTSQQLNNLKFAGLLKSRRDGTRVYYSLANDSIRKVIASIITEI